MKTLIAIFFVSLLSFTVIAQPVFPVFIRTGTNSNDHTGELIGRNTWQELNYDIGLFSGAISNLSTSLTASTNSSTPNLLKTSYAISEYSTNTFQFIGGSNFIGSYTNIFKFTTAGVNQGTNQVLTNNMSTDGGGTWVPYYFTNPISAVLFTNFYTNNFVTNYIVYTSVPGVTNAVGTNFANLSFLSTNVVITSAIGTNYQPIPVILSVLTGIPATGAVSVVTLSDNSLSGKYNGLAGQTLDFSNVTVLNLQLIGDGRNITNVSGTNLQPFTVNSNALDAATMAWLNSFQTTRYVSTNLTLATSATILFSPAFKDTNYAVLQDISGSLPTSLLITGKTTNSISTSMGLFTGKEAFGLIHQ